MTTRVILPFLNEAMYVVMEGVATAEAVDTSMRLGYGLPVGPLALADRMGLDEVMRWMQHLFDELGDVKYRPCPLLRKMIRGGQAGREVGQRVLRVRRGRGADVKEARRRPAEAPLPVDVERLRRQFPALTAEDLEAYVAVTRRILSARDPADRARITRETLARGRAARGRDDASGRVPDDEEQACAAPRYAAPPVEKMQRARLSPHAVE